MAKQSASEQLDQLVAAFLGAADWPRSPNGATPPFGSAQEPVMEVIRGLKNLPSPAFRARLKADLERRATMATPAAKAIPEFRATATPYLSVRGAAAAIEFYKKAFGATEQLRLMQPDGRIGHAEIDILGARILLADEFPEIGFRSPESLGGSPVLISLDVEDVDAVVPRAIAAGAEVVRPVADQFYGDRSGQLRDPFGYTWVVSTHKQTLSPEEMQRRSEEFSNRQTGATARAKQPPQREAFREGFHSITPYLIIEEAGRWIDFVEQAFGAEERLRVKRPGAGDIIMHAEVKIGDSMIELADANEQFPPMPSAIWLRVNDVDATYDRALEAGATPIQAPADMEYGSRDGSVKDLSGNHWYIHTPKPGNTFFQGLRSVTPYLHPLRGAVLIEFLNKAFGAEEVYRSQSPDGVIHHAQVRIGDSMIGMGDAHGTYQPMPSTLHLYVPDADRTYEQALRAGASSIQPPADQPYGERNAGVRDPFGNRWFIATPIRH
jgi:PhnB protein